MKFEFTKMHGAGNDYIYFDCFKQTIEDPSALSIALSDRHFSIGGDGIVMICPSDIADAKMRMFNIDGSEGKMCGNAIRCVAKFLYEKDICKKESISIETLSGIKYLDLKIENDKVTGVTVDMGKAILKPSEIPVNIDGETAIAKQIVNTLLLVFLWATLIVLFLMRWTQTILICIVSALNLRKTKFSLNKLTLNLLRLLMKTL